MIKLTHKGSRFEYEISRSLRNLEGVFYYKFPNQRNLRHPFDHLVLTPDMNYGIEEKKTERPSWRMEELRDKQKKSLLWFQKMRNHTSLIFINYRQGRGNIQAFSMNLEEFLRICEVMREELDRKSIPCDYLEKEKRVRELERISIDDSYGWDLSFLL